MTVRESYGETEVWKDVFRSDSTCHSLLVCWG